jgi:hypothetical protein
MTTFTVRQLDREPATVLDAADQEGVVQIKRRDGRIYLVRPEIPPMTTMKLPDFRARLKKIFPHTIPAAQVAIVDKLIAGE